MSQINSKGHQTWAALFNCLGLDGKRVLKKWEPGWLSGRWRDILVFPCNQSACLIGRLQREGFKVCSCFPASPQSWRARCLHNDFSLFSLLQNPSSMFRTSFTGFWFYLVCKWNLCRLQFFILNTRYCEDIKGYAILGNAGKSKWLEMPKNKITLFWVSSMKILPP